MTRWKEKAHGGLSPTQRTIYNYGKLGIREVVSSTEVHSNWCLVPVSLENIQASNIVWTEQVKYRYYFTTISKKEAMNLKRSRKMYMRVLGGRKRKEKCHDYIMILKTNTNKQINQNKRVRKLVLSPALHCSDSICFSLCSIWRARKAFSFAQPVDIAFAVGDLSSLKASLKCL